MRAGICHCLVCQKVHGAAFYVFAVFERDRVQLMGDLAEWQSSPRYTRLACAACGSRLGGRIGAELELSLPLFDSPGSIQPQYESWVIRRVSWLPALDVTQYLEDRIP